jgi:hypothetical protein
VWYILFMADKRINVALPSPLHARLRSVSDKTGISITNLLRFAVLEYLATSAPLGRPATRKG